MGTTARAPMRFSVRCETPTSWKMTAKFVYQTDAEAFASHLSTRHGLTELKVGLFHQNRLKHRYAHGRKYDIAAAVPNLQPKDGISTVTPIPPEVNQGQNRFGVQGSNVIT